MSASGEEADHVELPSCFSPRGNGSPETAPRRVRALWYRGVQEAELSYEPAPLAGPGDVRVDTLWTGLSRGTERLVFRGEVPADIAERMRAPGQAGSFRFPVKYGYCAVGRVEGTGEIVFALQPHQDTFIAPPDMLCAVPQDVLARRAVLAANMETALNAIWDAGAGPGDRIAVVGAGVIGLLVTYLAARLPGADVVAIDRDASRSGVVETLGAQFRTPAEAEGGADVVFHASASEEGLALALALAGEEATVVEMSWYGDRAVRAPLGHDFHARRLRLVSSQVGAVAQSRRPRWNAQRRLRKALELLRDDRLDSLIGEEIAFENLPRELPRLLAPGAPGLFTAIRYPAADESD